MKYRIFKQLTGGPVKKKPKIKHLEAKEGFKELRKEFMAFRGYTFGLQYLAALVITQLVIQPSSLRAQATKKKFIRPQQPSTNQFKPKPIGDQIPSESPSAVTKNETSSETKIVKAIPVEDDETFPTTLPESAFQNITKAIPIDDGDIAPPPFTKPQSAPVIGIGESIPDPFQSISKQESDNNSGTFTMVPKKVVTPMEEEELQENAQNLLFATGSGLALISAATYLWNERQNYVKYAELAQRKLSMLRNKSSMGEDTRELVASIDQELNRLQKNMDQAEKRFIEAEKNLALEIQKNEARYRMALGESLTPQATVKNYLTKILGNTQKKYKEHKDLIESPELDTIEKLLGWRYAEPVKSKNPEIDLEIENLKSIDSQITALNNTLNDARSKMQNEISSIQSRPEFLELLSTETDLEQKLSQIERGKSTTPKSHALEKVMNQAKWAYLRKKYTPRADSEPERIAYEKAHQKWMEQQLTDKYDHLVNLETVKESIGKTVEKNEEEILKVRQAYSEVKDRIQSELVDTKDHIKSKKRLLESKVRKELDPALSAARATLISLEETKKRSTFSESDTIIINAQIDNAKMDIQKLEEERKSIIADIENSHTSPKPGLLSQRDSIEQRISDLRSKGSTIEVQLKEKIADLEKLHKSFTSTKEGTFRHTQKSLKEAYTKLAEQREKLVSDTFLETEAAAEKYKTELKSISDYLNADAESITGMTILANDRELNILRKSLSDAQNEVIRLSAKNRPPKEIQQARILAEEAAKKLLKFQKEKSAMTTESLLERKTLLETKLSEHETFKTDAQSYLAQVKELQEQYKLNAQNVVPNRAITIPSVAKKITQKCATLIKLGQNP